MEHQTKILRVTTLASFSLMSEATGYIVKRVSWFKSSLLLRIQIKYPNELQFLIKTESSIFNRKAYATDSKRENQAWLGLG